MDEAGLLVAELLIEPFWNWNFHDLYEDCSNFYAFNRTILELKHEIKTDIVLGDLTFNRTILELKHDATKALKDQQKAFNRTILELKLI